jgi:general secretion pathway protein N
LLFLSSARADDGNVRQPEPLTVGPGETPKLSAGATPPVEPPNAVPEVEPAKGNPLWSATLRSLSATRERPLFSPSRRPPDVAAPISPPPNVAAPPPPQTAVAADEAPPFTLLGTVLSADTRLAVLLNKTTNAVTRLREGQSEEGWTARKVDPRAAVLDKDGVENTLELPKTSDPPANPPPTAGDDTQSTQ